MANLAWPALWRGRNEVVSVSMLNSLETLRLHRECADCLSPRSDIGSIGCRVVSR
jgi:hypothetical protein